MMQNTPVVVSLPIADRRTSFIFYREGLGFAAFGEPGEDGIPEPLQFALNDGVHVMLIPTGGFDRITGDRQVAPSGTSECVLVLATGTDEGVDEVIQRAQVAGADVITPPGQQPWGYAGAFADPDGHIWMVRSEGQVGRTMEYDRITVIGEGGDKRIVGWQDGAKVAWITVEITQPDGTSVWWARECKREEEAIGHLYMTKFSDRRLASAKLVRAVTPGDLMAKIAPSNRAVALAEWSRPRGTLHVRR